MPTFMHIDKTDVTAAKETQVQFLRSDLPVSDEVKEIESQIEKDPLNAELWMKKGLALAKQMLFREAIEAYSVSVSCDPFHALTYRHRGHRYISVRCFEQAAADLEISSRLDPTNWDTWYHLGLAYYLMKDYQRAAKAYQRCLEITNTEELLVAIVDWYWMTCKRLGDEKKAAELLELVNENTDPGENLSYKMRVLMYKGLIKPEDMMHFEGAEFPDLEIATQGYGVSNYYYLNGDIEKSNEVLEKILTIKSFWSAFGFLAALVDARTRGLDFEIVNL